MEDSEGFTKERIECMRVDLFKLTAKGIIRGRRHSKKKFFVLLPHDDIIGEPNFFEHKSDTR